MEQKKGMGKAPGTEKKQEAPKTSGVLSEEAKKGLENVGSTDPLLAAAADRTKSGRKSKTAKEAENQIEMITIIGPSLGSINEMAGKRWPEMRHSELELEAITKAMSKVLSKYVDNAAMKYQDEIVLAVLLGGSLADKGIRLSRRMKDEKASKMPTVQGKEGAGAGESG